MYGINDLNKGNFFYIIGRLCCCKGLKCAEVVRNMEKIKYKIAVVQMDSGEDVSQNLRLASDVIDEAAASGAQIVCFPEMMSQLVSQRELPASESIANGPTTALLRRKAREKGIYIHGGSFPEYIEGERRTYNTSVLIDPDGQIAAQYRKIHTFDVTLPDGTPCRESAGVKAGSEVTVADTPFGRWGMAICYDLRFPELFRKMAIAGAQVIFLPANFTGPTGRDHWEVLLRARAIENGCYLVAADQCGVKPDFVSFGTSMVVDPWGNVIARAAEERPEIIYAVIDPVRVEEVRRQLPVLENRRADVYGSFEAVFF